MENLNSRKANGATGRLTESFQGPRYPGASSRPLRGILKPSPQAEASTRHLDNRTVFRPVETLTAEGRTFSKARHDPRFVKLYSHFSLQDKKLSIFQPQFDLPVDDGDSLRRQEVKKKSVKRIGSSQLAIEISHHQSGSPPAITMSEKGQELAEKQKEKENFPQHAQPRMETYSNTWPCPDARNTFGSPGKSKKYQELKTKYPVETPVSKFRTFEIPLDEDPEKTLTSGKKEDESSTGRNIFVEETAEVSTCQKALEVFERSFDSDSGFATECLNLSSADQSVGSIRSSLTSSSLQDYLIRVTSFSSTASTSGSSTLETREPVSPREVKRDERPYLQEKLKKPAKASRSSKRMPDEEELNRITVLEDEDSEESSDSSLLFELSTTELSPKRIIHLRNILEASTRMVDIFQDISNTCGKVAHAFVLSALIRPEVSNRAFPLASVTYHNAACSVAINNYNSCFMRVARKRPFSEDDFDNAIRPMFSALGTMYRVARIISFHCSDLREYVEEGAEEEEDEEFLADFNHDSDIVIADFSMHMEGMENEIEEDDDDDNKVECKDVKVEWDETDSVYIPDGHKTPEKTRVIEQFKEASDIINSIVLRLEFCIESFKMSFHNFKTEKRNEERGHFVSALVGVFAGDSVTDLEEKSPRARHGGGILTKALSTVTKRCSDVKKLFKRS